MRASPCSQTPVRPSLYSSEEQLADTRGPCSSSTNPEELEPIRGWDHTVQFAAPKTNMTREVVASNNCNPPASFAHLVAFHLLHRYYNCVCRPVALQHVSSHSRCSFRRVGRHRTMTWASNTTSSKGLFPRRWIRSLWSKPMLAFLTWMTSSAKRQVD